MLGMNKEGHGVEEAKYFHSFVIEGRERLSGQDNGWGEMTVVSLVSKWRDSWDYLGSSGRVNLAEVEVKALWGIYNQGLGVESQIGAGSSKAHHYVSLDFSINRRHH